MTDEMAQRVLDAIGKVRGRKNLSRIVKYWYGSSPRCVYCSRKADTVDHVQPVMLGGHSNIQNIVPSCFWCNNDKGSMTPKNFFIRYPIRANHFAVKAKHVSIALHNLAYKLSQEYK